MNNPFLRLVCFTSLTLLALVGCSGNYGFESNLKGDNFTEYFSASEVKIYEHENTFNAPHKYLGIVEGDDCQAKTHLAKPDKINARTAARKAAFQLNANAIVFTSCVDIESKQCVAQIVCYAKAYQVSDQAN